MKKILLVGGGGHCKVVLSILKKLNSFEIVAISDLEEKINNKISGVKIKYSDSQLDTAKNDGIKCAFITLGSVGNPVMRVEKFELIKKIGFEIPIIVSPDAIVSEGVSIGEGTVIMPGVIINTGVSIGKNCIVNTGAIIDHDCVVGDHVHIAPGVTMSGAVKIGDRTHIGTGTNIIQNISVGENCIVGAGSLVIRDVGKNAKVVGVPAKKIER